MIRSITILGIALAFVSCAGSNDNETPTNDTIPAINDSASMPVSVSLPDTIAPAAATATAGRINPPHGEPGHVCEVEVGKPIPDNLKGSAPAEKITAAPSSSPITINPAPAPASTQPVTISTGPGADAKTSTVTAPGMNPPHGQPGHDCAIPVGSPLKK